MSLKLAWLATPLLLIFVQLAEAQQAQKILRVGIAAAQTRPDRRIETFRQGLRDLGYLEGRNIKIDYRGQENRARLADLIDEFVREKVDVIVTRGAATRVGHLAGNVPVIFGFSGDPVEAKLIKSWRDLEQT